MKTSKITVESLNEEIEKKIELRDRIMELLNEPCKSFEESILQKYIELQSVRQVAALVNEAGYRLKSANGERKYLSTDISEIIVSKESDTNPDMKELAKLLHLRMKKKVNRLYN